MYKNIGGKIKRLSEILFEIEAAGLIIGGIVLKFYYGFNTAICLLIAVLGPIVAWISSWFLCGFGQLIENSDNIAQDTRAIKGKLCDEKKEAE